MENFKNIIGNIFNSLEKQQEQLNLTKVGNHYPYFDSIIKLEDKDVYLTCFADEQEQKLIVRHEFYDYSDEPFYQDKTVLEKTIDLNSPIEKQLLQISTLTFKE